MGDDTVPSVVVPMPFYQPWRDRFPDVSVAPP